MASSLFLVFLEEPVFVFDLQNDLRPETKVSEKRSLHFFTRSDFFPKVEGTEKVRHSHVVRSVPPVLLDCLNCFFALASSFPNTIQEIRHCQYSQAVVTWPAPSCSKQKTP